MAETMEMPVFSPPPMHMSQLPIGRLYLTIRVYAEPDGRHRPDRPKEYQDLGPCTYYRRYRARSFVKGFGHMVVKCMGGSAALTQNDIGGVSRTLLNASSLPSGPTIWIQANAAASQTSTGVVVGTGNTAVTMGDTQLVALIATGTGSGQLVANVASGTAPAISGSDCVQICRRSFTNLSGATIGVQESGIHASWYIAGPTQVFFLIVRDVFSVVNVVNYSTLAIDYTWKTSL